ncbi:MAG: hypothetical protein P8Y67_13825 [Alphaproteobacteria bacterium]
MVSDGGVRKIIIYFTIFYTLLLEYCVIWMFVHLWRHKKLGSVYLVTNMRALCIVAERKGRHVWSALPGEIQIREKRIDKGTVGDLVFLYESAKHPEKNIIRERVEGFASISDVEGAEKALKMLIRSSGD